MVASRLLILLTAFTTLLATGTRGVAQEPRFTLSTFSVDVTIPLGHRCMGILPTKSTKIADPLYAHGFVLQGGEAPIVLCAVDWCEIRNDSYEQWRSELAAAAGTTPKHVLLSCLHQHDAPVVDRGAAQLLRQVGLDNELFDEEFHNETVKRVAKAVHNSLDSASPVTHYGIGQATVEKIASNRRVVNSDGTVTFARGSSSGANPQFENAPVGQIDPELKTLSFWNGDEPLVALHAYATHPMSYYGRGEVSADFVGLARARRQRDDFSIKQIYVSGCSGDVTAGKFNTGSPEDRSELTERLYQAMVTSWRTTKRMPLQELAFRCAKLDLEMHPGPFVSREQLESILADENASTENRILAAMGLSSHQRLERGLKIDLPCLDLGQAKVVLFPGESFVGYQLMAQAMAEDSLVLSIGYGECWPGYIPTEAAFADGFDENWLWAAPGSEQRIRAALKAVLD